MIYEHASRERDRAIADALDALPERARRGLPDAPSGELAWIWHDRRETSRKWTRPGRVLGV
jgi:hypothetical protein